MQAFKAHPGRFTLHERRTEIPTPSAMRRPHGFQPRPGPARFILHGAESGAIEAHTRRCALVSSEAQALPGSPSVPYRGFEPRTSRI